MAMINVKITGSAIQEKEASTVGELKAGLGLSTHTAKVNGSPANDSDSLATDDFVVLSPAVKGGLN